MCLSAAFCDMEGHRRMIQIEGLILAGGKSTRMGGRRKGSLTYHEETFIQILIRELHPAAERIWLSYGQDYKEAYEGCDILRDIYRECGPIGGIHAGLSVCRQEWMMVAACDMPLLKIALFQHLWNELELAGEHRRITEYPGNVRGGRPFYDGAVPVAEGRIHPLAAIYRKSMAGILEEQIRRGKLRLRDALGRMRILYVDVSGQEEFEEMLQNINTVKEYEELLGRG